MILRIAFKIRTFRFQPNDEKTGIKKPLSIFILFNRNVFLHITKG